MSFSKGNLESAAGSAYRGRRRRTSLQSSWVRNLLISIGAFWLPRQLVVPASLLVGRLFSGLRYGETLFGAVSMGVVLSMGRALCAALGGTIVMLAAVSRKPQYWACVVALLYAVAAQPRFFPWHGQRPAWDRVFQVADILWPAVVCMIVAVSIAKSRSRSKVEKITQPVM